MPESTTALWAAVLDDVDYEDALSAIGALVLGMDRMPSLHQLVTAARAAKRERFLELPDGAPEGPSLAEWLADNPEYRQRVDAIAMAAMLRDGRTETTTPEPPEVRARRIAKRLDRPQAAEPRTPHDGHAHSFLLRDRCYYCGAPEEPEEEREPA